MQNFERWLKKPADVIVNFHSERDLNVSTYAFYQITATNN